jgi:hypothetical protein
MLNHPALEEGKAPPKKHYEWRLPSVAAANDSARSPASCGEAILMLRGGPWAMAVLGDGGWGRPFFQEGLAPKNVFSRKGFPYGALPSRPVEVSGLLVFVVGWFLVNI